MNIQEFFKIGMKRDIPDLLPNLELSIELGNNKPGAKYFDIRKGWDGNFDSIPIDSDTINTIHAYHFFEHLHDPIFCLMECQRVLKPGGHINIVVPYYKSSMAFHDLTHKSFYNENSWDILFNNNYYNPVDFKFDVHCCFIMGVVERNLALFTQLRKPM